MLQKLKIPDWASVLTQPPGGREQSAIDSYERLILALCRQEPAITSEKASQECGLVETIPLPPLVVLRQRLGNRAPDMTILREVLKPFVAAGPFDRDFYLDRYPDLMRASASGMLPDPQRHFAEHGYFEGRFGQPHDPWLE